MKFTVRPLTPSETLALQRTLQANETVRADVGLWLSEVQAGRCLVDRTCFLLLRGAEPAGYLLALTRHGHALCTALDIVAGPPHAGVWHLVHAFMERLVELTVDSADFCLSPRVPAARTLLVQLGATEIGQRTDTRFGTGTRAVLQLDASHPRFMSLNLTGRNASGSHLIGRSGDPASVPVAPPSVDSAGGSRGGKPVDGHL